MTSYAHELEVNYNAKFTPRSHDIPSQYREAVNKEINRMLALNVIRRSKSSFINPIVPTIKKNNEVSLCLDARFLNLILFSDHETVESIDALLQRCHGVKVMSS